MDGSVRWELQKNKFQLCEKKEKLSSTLGCPNLGSDALRNSSHSDSLEAGADWMW